MVSIQKSSRASFTTWLVAETSCQDLPVTDAVDTPADQQSRMSALGQKRTFAVQNGMSALPPKATSNAPYGDVAKSGHRALHSITSSARFCTAPIAQSCFASKGQKELAALYAVNDISVPLRVLRKNKAPQQTGDERCGNR